jgi:NAD(P)-dependent dehydrogenase (short-subunit alcohol dehydrogenase family)
MLVAVAEARDYLATQPRRPALTSVHADPARRVAVRSILSPILRGALARREDGAAMISDWRDDAALLDFVSQEASVQVAGRGCITPDHSIRTKPFPAWLDGVGPDAGELGTDELERRVSAGLDRFARQYAQYFASNSGRSPTPLTRLDLLPRVVAVPGLGIAGLGRTRAQAQIAADLYQHAVQVMTEAEAIGSYRPVSAADLFDVEYWSLEQAKLGARRSEGALAGKVALVTGAASGIGLATATHFLALGAHLVLVDRDGAALELAHGALKRRFGASVTAQLADLTDPAQARAAIQAASLVFGGLDIVVSNAGTAPSGALHGSDGTALLEQSLQINLLSHQYVAQCAAELFISQRMGGCLLFNASKSAFNPGPLFGPYAVAKSALIALMKQYAIDLAPFGVRANAVNADRVRTGLFSEELIESRSRARGLSADAYFRTNLLNRETLSEDVAQAFGYLAAAGATTGAVVPVDGGNPAAFPR